MDFLEKDLEDVIFECSKTKEGFDLLDDRGIGIWGKMYRQVNLGSYGIADLISFDISNRYTRTGRRIRTLYVKVYELKKDVIGVESMLQVCRYISAIRSLFEDSPHYAECELEISGVLIGRRFDKSSDFAFLYNEIDNIDIYTYDYKIDGIKFEHISKCWRRTDPNFSEELVSSFNAPTYSEIKDILKFSKL